MPERIEIDAGVRERVLEVVSGGFRQAAGGRHHPLGGLAQLGAVCAQRLRAAGGFDVRAHRAHEQLERLPAAPERLAPEQVEGLDAIRPLMNRVQPIVPVELLDGIFARVTVAAVHLDGEIAGLDAVL